MRSMQWQLGILRTISAFAYRHRETKKNLCRGGRSQDLPTASSPTSKVKTAIHTQYNQYTQDNNTHKTTTTIHTVNQQQLYTRQLKTSNSTHEKNQNFADLYSLPNIVPVVKSRRMRWAGHVTRVGEGRGVHRVLPPPFPILLFTSLHLIPLHFASFTSLHFIALRYLPRQITFHFTVKLSLHQTPLLYTFAMFRLPVCLDNKRILDINSYFSLSPTCRCFSCNKFFFSGFFLISVAKFYSFMRFLISHNGECEDGYLQ